VKKKDEEEEEKKKKKMNSFFLYIFILSFFSSLLWKFCKHAISYLYVQYNRLPDPQDVEDA